MTHQASREAYAREHVLSANEMEQRVRTRHNNAAMYAYQARWDRLLGTNYTLTQEEAEAMEKAFSVRNKPTIPVKYCPTCGFKKDESCGYCKVTPRCHRCNVILSDGECVYCDYAEAEEVVMRGYPVGITYTIKDKPAMEAMRRLQQKWWSHRMRFVRLGESL